MTKLYIKIVTYPLALAALAGCSGIGGSGSSSDDRNYYSSNTQSVTPLSAAVASGKDLSGSSTTLQAGSTSSVSTTSSYSVVRKADGNLVAKFNDGREYVLSSKQATSDNDGYYHYEDSDDRYEYASGSDHDFLKLESSESGSQYAYMAHVELSDHRDQNGLKRNLVFGLETAVANIPQNQNLTYQGKWKIETVRDYSNGVFNRETELGGIANIGINTGTNAVTGNLAVNKVEVSDRYRTPGGNISLVNGALNGNGITAGLTSDDTLTNTVGVSVNGSLSGKIFGSSAQEIGGGIQATVNGTNGAGYFIARDVNAPLPQRVPLNPSGTNYRYDDYYEHRYGYDDDHDGRYDDDDRYEHRYGYDD